MPNHLVSSSIRKQSSPSKFSYYSVTSTSNCAFLFPFFSLFEIVSSWIIDNVSIVSRNLGVKIGLKSRGSCDFLSDRSGVVRKGQKRSHFFHRLLLTWFSIFKGSSRKINWHASIYVVMNILCNNAEMAFRWKKKGLRDLKIYFLQWREKGHDGLDYCA